MVVFHELRLYWDWAGSNIGAMPGCGIIAVIFAVAFRKPLATWWKKHFGAKADLDEIRDLADKAHKAVSSLFEQAGRHHDEQMRQAARHHREALDRADVHQVAMQQHVTAAVATTVKSPAELAAELAAHQRATRPVGPPPPRPPRVPKQRAESDAT